MRNGCLEAALRELENAGIRDVEQVRGGTHLQIRWRVNGHDRRFYSMPATPSDVRAVANTRAGIRRLLRMDGAIAAPAPRKAVRAAKPARPSEPACWHRLADEIERRGTAAVLADIERVTTVVGTAIAEFVGESPAEADPQLGDNPTSHIIRITNELRDASASMRRAIIVARVLAAMPLNQKDRNHG